MALHDDGFIAFYAISVLNAGARVMDVLGDCHVDFFCKRLIFQDLVKDTYWILRSLVSKAYLTHCNRIVI